MAQPSQNPELMISALRKLADALESGKHAMLDGSFSLTPMYECLSTPVLSIDADHSDHYAYDYSTRVRFEVIYRRVRPEKAAT